MNRDTLLTRRAILGGAAALAVVAVLPAEAARRRIRGNVVYRARIALPRNARVSVELVDVSLADAPSKTIARTSFRPDGGAPIPYELTYDSADIRRGRSYALQARIMVGDRLMFINTTRHSVFDGGRERTDIVVELTGNAGDDEADESPAGSWRVEDIRGGVIGNAEVTLQIAADGKVSGSGGCNRYFGKATIQGDTIRLGGLGSTRMACEPALMKLEGTYHETLEAVRTFKLHPRRRKLVLLDRRGREVVSLARM